MKKVFNLIDPKKKLERVADQIRSEIKRYIKRERKKKLDLGYDYWDFDCRFGNTKETSDSIKISDINSNITNIIENGLTKFYLEVLAKQCVRASNLKTILVTGSTDGIGLKLSRKFLSMGHRVLIHGRSSEKLASLKRELDKETVKNSSNTVNCEFYQADFSILGDVRRFANELISKHEKIDLLINNAGVFKVADADIKTKDGFDIRFMVNAYAPCLLTRKLLPILDKNSKIINISSAAQASISTDAMKGEGEQLDHFEAYAQSKLALTMWSQEFAKDQPMTVLAVNPGSLLATKMVQEGFSTQGNNINIGVDVLFKLSFDPRYRANSGEYFDNDLGDFTPAHEDLLSKSKVKKVLSIMYSVS